MRNWARDCRASTSSCSNGTGRAAGRGGRASTRRCAKAPTGSRGTRGRSSTPAAAAAPRFPDLNPLAVWPEPGGFLPFANSIDADEICWLTTGDPATWPVLVRPRHAEQGPPLTGTLTALLLEWPRGRFPAPGFAELDEDDDPLDFIGFEPWPDAAYW